MSMMVSFCAVLFPQDVLDEILNLTESVSEGFPTYSFNCLIFMSPFHRFRALNKVLGRSIASYRSLTFSTQLRLASPPSCCHWERPALLPLIVLFRFMCSLIFFLIYETEFVLFLTVLEKFFLAHRIRISACFTWTDNSYLTHVISPRTR